MPIEGAHPMVRVRSSMGTLKLESERSAHKYRVGDYIKRACHAIEVGGGVGS